MSLGLPFLRKRRGFRNISLIFAGEILTPCYAPILVENTYPRAFDVYAFGWLAAGCPSASHPQRDHSSAPFSRDHVVWDDLDAPSGCLVLGEVPKKQ